LFLSEGQTGEALNPSKKAMLFRKSGGVWQITAVTCSRSAQLHRNDAHMHPSHTHTHTQHATPITYLQCAFCVYKTDFTSVPKQTNRRTDTLLPDQCFTIPQQYGSCTPSIVDASAAICLRRPQHTHIKQNTHFLHTINCCGCELNNKCYRCIMNWLNNCSRTLNRRCHFEGTVPNIRLYFRHFTSKYFEIICIQRAQN
jgi:hypothetical protein